MFELRHSDLAGRIGRLETPHGVVETPAFVPVVHPVCGLRPFFGRSRTFTKGSLA